MAIAFDATSSIGFDAASQTLSHTCTGSDRLLVVSVIVDGAQTVTAITYNGVAMTLIKNYFDVFNNYLYYLVNPASGTNDISVTLSGAQDSVIMASSYTGVDQTAPLEQFRFGVNTTAPWGFPAAKLLGSAYLTTNLSSYTLTPTTYPTANNLILLAVMNSDADAPETPTVTGLSCTWDQIATIDFRTIATPLKRVTFFRACDAAPDTSGNITIDTGGDAQTGVAAVLFEVVSSAAVASDNGASAIIQNNTNRADSGTTASTTLSAFGDSVFNMAVMMVGLNSTADLSQEAGYSMISEGTYSTPDSGLGVEIKIGEDTSPSMTWTGTIAWGAIGLEVKGASIVTATAGDLLVLSSGDGNNTAAARTPTSGSNERQDMIAGSGAGTFGAYLGDRITTTAGAYSLGYTDASAITSAAIVAAFKPVSGGGGGATTYNYLTLLGVGT